MSKALILVDTIVSEMEFVTSTSKPSEPINHTVEEFEVHADSIPEIHDVTTHHQ